MSILDKLGIINKVQNTIDLSATGAPEEHRMQLAGLDIGIIHSVKVVIIVDQTGVTGEAGTEALKELERWLWDQGYFLHCVQVTSPVKPPAPRVPDEGVLPETR